MKTKTCYKCKEKKSKSEMTLIGVWVCNDCIKPNKALKKASKKYLKTKEDEQKRNN